MPRILSLCLRHKRKLAIYAITLMAFVLLATPLWPFSLLMVLMVAVIVLDRKVPICDYGVMAMLHGRQQIRKIDTLVIGDTCLDSLIAPYRKGDTLSIQHPDRSFDSSFQIFMHIESLLTSGDHLVIVNDTKVVPHGFTIFDIPYLNLITQKELGIEHLVQQSRHPMFYEPLRSFKILMHAKKRNYRPVSCPHTELVRFCADRAIELVYLER